LPSKLNSEMALESGAANCAIRLPKGDLAFEE